ncbi:MAG: LysM peptidoglycan-binding domain-containing protein [Peptococcaceae bacterium]|nr:LysM peptidoglycan-binding domain-containing protein [Peptococcaceae bacterium]
MARTYTVRTGDTLFEIARRFGITVERLARANNITNPELIFVGQVLTIPDDAEGGAPGGGAAAGNQASRRVGGLLYTLLTDKAVYRRGEEVVITLTKTNVSRGNITLRYRNAQRYDFVARRGQDSREVWRWSRGRSFAQAAGEETLRPGDSQVFQVVWDQRNNRGRQVEPGAVIIEGFNVAEGLADNGISTTIRIRAVEPAPPPTPAPVPCPDMNILANPGFEDWPDSAASPAGWAGSNLFRTRLSRSGNFAAGLGDVPDQRAVLAQRVEIEPGRIYNLSWWARENIQPGGVGRFTLLVEVFYYGRSGAFVGRTEPVFSQDNIPDGAYQQFSLSTGRVPAGARTAEVRFTFEPAGNNNNTVKIDDVELRCRF